MNLGKQLTLSEIKTMSLDILNEVANFCEGHNLRYWLYYGTLIGAIRHNGFIPWDDDIDIIMPRPDYEKFIRTFNLQTELPYKVIEDRITPGYHTPFAKVHNPRTIIESEYSNEMSYGIFIDVFPFDGCGDNGQLSKMRILMKLLSAKVNKWWGKRSLINNIGLEIFKALLCFVPTSIVLREIHKLSMKYSFDEAEKVDYINGNNTIVQRNWLVERKCYHIFEGFNFRIPSNYDACLRANYGDYMKLPPKEEQVGHPANAYWVKD